MGGALLWEAELGEGQADGQRCSWAASLLDTITTRQHHCQAPGIPVHVSEVKIDMHKAPALLCVSGDDGSGQVSKCHFHLAAQFKIELHIFHVLCHLGHRVPKSPGQTI